MPKGVYPKTDEHRKNLSIASKKRKITNKMKRQWIKNLKGRMKNKKHSKETKEKMSKTALKRVKEGKHHWYKGGRIKDKEGYILIKKIKHPFCNSEGYVRAHRLIIEQQIGRYLMPEEQSHHLNEIKDDNRPENLMAFTNNSAHIRFHYNPDSIKSNKIIFDGRKLTQ